MWNFRKPFKWPNWGCHVTTLEVSFSFSLPFPPWVVVASLFSPSPANSKPPRYSLPLASSISIVSISRTPSLSLSLLSTLSFSWPPFFFSLRSSHGQHLIVRFLPPSPFTCRLGRIKGGWNVWPLLPDNPAATVEGLTSACSVTENFNVKWRIPSRFDSGSWLKQVPLGLLVVIVPSIPDESSWIVGTLFPVKWQNFDSWFETNGALFWGNDLESILVVKMIFDGI